MIPAGSPDRLADLAFALHVRAVVLVVLGAVMIAVVVLSSNTNARAQASGRLDHSVVVVNSRGVVSGSIETFAAGSKKNNTPEFLDVLSGEVAILQAASGVAVSPVSFQNFVCSTNQDAVLGFSPTATGANILPEIEIFQTVTLPLFEFTPYFPTGVAFDSMAHPTLDTTGDIYVANYSSFYCGGGSIGVYPGPDDAAGTAPPNLILEDCTTPMLQPVGLFVDETTINICLGTADTATDLCNPAEGNLIIPVPTRRIWVVNRNGGYVTIYAPDLADTLDQMRLSSFCVPDSNNTPAPTNFCVEPPFGGFFYTTTDGLSPFNGSSDTTTPNYLAVNTSETDAYITDISGGFKGRGRVKAFALQGSAVCLEQESGNCKVAATPFLSRTDTVMDKEIAGARTMINLPMGISVATVAGGDELFVTNVNNNSLVEFGPGASGEAAPIAVVEGPSTGMIQPAGNAITNRPPLIP